MCKNAETFGRFQADENKSQKESEKWSVLWVSLGEVDGGEFTKMLGEFFRHHLFGVETAPLQNAYHS